VSRSQLAFLARSGSTGWTANIKYPFWADFFLHVGKYNGPDLMRRMVNFEQFSHFNHWCHCFTIIKMITLKNTIEPTNIRTSGIRRFRSFFTGARVLRFV